MDALELLSHYGETDPADDVVIATAAMAVLAERDAERHGEDRLNERSQPSRQLRTLIGVGTAATVFVVAALVTFGTNRSSDLPPIHHAAIGGRAVLYRLASASVAAPATEGRYVVLAETDTETGYPGQSERTTVIDTLTGASTTYQRPYSGTDAPSTLTEGPDPTSTEAWYSALPTDPTALRAKLLALAKQQEIQATQEMRKKAEQMGQAIIEDAGQPKLSDDDYVYEEADTLLWSPLVQPALRSALYRVLAGTSGFTINVNATDPAGRPAIAMTRHYNGVQEKDITYEDPTNGAVLAQVWTETDDAQVPSSQQQAVAKAVNGNPELQKDTDTTIAVYRPVTSANDMPANPYAS